MSQHTIQTYQEESTNADWRWRIVVKDTGDVVADSGEGYRNKKDMLNSLFGIFFGDYDETFLDLYVEWNPEDDPMGVQRQPDAPPVEVPELTKEALNPATGAP